MEAGAADRISRDRGRGHEAAPPPPRNIWSFYIFISILFPIYIAAK